MSSNSTEKVETNVEAIPVAAAPIEKVERNADVGDVKSEVKDVKADVKTEKTAVKDVKAEKAEVKSEKAEVNTENTSPEPKTAESAEDLASSEASLADLLGGTGILTSPLPASKQWYYSQPSDPLLPIILSPPSITATSLFTTLSWLLISAMLSALFLVAMGTMCMIMGRIGREREEEAELPRFWSSERVRRRMAASVEGGAVRGRGQWPAELSARAAQQPRAQLNEEPLYSAPTDIRQSSPVGSPPVQSIRTPAGNPPSYAAAMGKPAPVLRTVFVNQPLYTT